MKVKHKRLHRMEGQIIAVFPTIDVQFQVDWGNGLVSTEFEESLIFLSPHSPFPIPHSPMPNAQ
ncbi:hypothetical protein NIES25_51760 [Nostoc linckia NIES-25]|nr:hypothetical protein NIES25_05800 [Nostoc linckia NIES-25]BAY78672.1 hypothetical protein NIES25_51480 [Nostoc linckia NIES-25]BAY78700.1 hypothetical protein NIES25_51760 [Nostoc linckia NIES-25]